MVVSSWAVLDRLEAGKVRMPKSLDNHSDMNGCCFGPLSRKLLGILLRPLGGFLDGLEAFCGSLGAIFWRLGTL
eukprot:731831-Pyramimonas_sp.AAC.1